MRVGDYVTVWDPDKMKAKCEGCDNLSQESRTFLIEQAEQSRFATKSLDTELQALATDTKEGKVILETFQQIQRICVFKMGTAFDEELSSQGVADEVPCEDGSVITRLVNSTLAMLRNSLAGLFNVLGFGMGLLQFAFGDALVTLRSWGEKLACFILTNPESAKMMLACAKFAKRKLAVSVAQLLDDNGFLKSIELFIRQKQIP